MENTVAPCNSLKVEAMSGRGYLFFTVILFRPFLRSLRHESDQGVQVLRRILSRQLILNDVGEAVIEGIVK